MANGKAPYVFPGSGAFTRRIAQQRGEPTWEGEMNRLVPVTRAMGFISAVQLAPNAEAQQDLLRRAQQQVAILEAAMEAIYAAGDEVVAAYNIEMPSGDQPAAVRAVAGTVGPPTPTLGVSDRQPIVAREDRVPPPPGITPGPPIDPDALGIRTSIFDEPAVPGQVRARFVRPRTQPTGEPERPAGPRIMRPPEGQGEPQQPAEGESQPGTGENSTEGQGEPQQPAQTSPNEGGQEEQAEARGEAETTPEQTAPAGTGEPAAESSGDQTSRRPRRNLKP